MRARITFCATYWSLGSYLPSLNPFSFYVQSVRLAERKNERERVRVSERKRERETDKFRQAFIQPPGCSITERGSPELTK